MNYIFPETKFVRENNKDTQIEHDTDEEKEEAMDL